MSAVSPGGSIGIYDLKNQLSAVLEEVMEGKEVTVTKHGRPIARIAPSRRLIARIGRPLLPPSASWVREFADCRRRRRAES